MLLRYSGSYDHLHLIRKLGGIVHLIPLTVVSRNFRRRLITESSETIRRNQISAAAFHQSPDFSSKRAHGGYPSSLKCKPFLIDDGE
jgi:hypothetical protein